MISYDYLLEYKKFYILINNIVKILLITSRYVLYKLYLSGLIRYYLI